MTPKTKKGLIIAVAILIFLCTLILTSSIGGISRMNELKYLIDNGKVVTGEVAAYKKGRGYPTYSGLMHYYFTLEYRYEENGRVFTASEQWSVAENKPEELSEREIRCRNRVGKPIELIVADNGCCEIAGNEQSLYKNAYNFVYVRGGTLLAVDILLVAALFVIIFYKPPQKKNCNFIDGNG